MTENLPDQIEYETEIAEDEPAQFSEATEAQDEVEQ